MNRRHLYILCALLTAVGVFAFAYKTLVLGFPATPDHRVEIWRADVKIDFVAEGKPVKVSLAIPETTDQFAIIDQTFISPGYGFATVPADLNRRAVFTTREGKGEQTIYYRAVFQKTSERAKPTTVPRPQVGRIRFQNEELTAARAVVDRLWKQSADEASFVTLVLDRLRGPGRSNELRLLLGQRPSVRQRMQLAADMIRLSRIPARAVHGLPLVGLRRHVAFQHWLEVYIDGAWHSFDPKDGRRQPPANTVPWWRGPGPLVRIEGATPGKTDVATSRAYEVALQTAMVHGREKHSAFVEFSVLGLPIQMRAVYQILLAVPIGIMVLVILRNVIGMKTFGTFMPVLMAMAFRQTDVLWGVALFTLVCGLGLMVRFYLERLKLLLVPRLAAVVIVVIAIMAVLSVFSHKLGFERGLSVALFPIVILAMTIERMSIVWEERGAKEAFQQTGGSLAVAVVCYLVMNLDIVRHLFFVFPELLLVVLAATLLLGRYTGYRLVELPRFKVLAGLADKGRGETGGKGSGN